MRRLQIDKGEIKLLDPCKPNIYNQTEIEDCLNPRCYYEAVMEGIRSYGNGKLKSLAKKYSFVEESTVSVLRGDDSCIQATDCKVISQKHQIIDFAENSENKYNIAKLYIQMCETTTDNVEHKLKDCIIDLLDIHK